nr:MAG TPA: hypothetical protein [Bacteriophage sp.]
MKMVIEQKKAINMLMVYRNCLTRQQFKTLKGQILSGDTDGFQKGMERLLRRVNRNGN